MSSSGSDFDDDDDELLQAVITGRATVENNKVVPTQMAGSTPYSNINSGTNISNVSQGIAPQTAPVVNLTKNIGNGNSNTHGAANEIQSKLYRAEGEVAILRAQLNQIQRQKQDEIFRLRDSHNQFRKSNEDQVSALKYAVQKLEDEKKFLNNELKTTSHTKRRKLASESAFSQNNGNTSGIDVDISPVSVEIPVAPSNQSIMVRNVGQEGGDTTGQLVAEEPAELPHKTVSQQIFQLQQTTSFFADQIWNHCIIGSDRTSLNYLDKISIHFDIHVRDLKIAKRTPVSSAIVEFLMLKKSLRLDELVEDFCLSLVEVVEILQESKTILAIPFLLSFIHCSITFRPAAITPGLIEQLLRKFSHFSNSSSFLLNSNLNEEDYINYHDVPNQVMILEKFFFICCLDIVEKLVSVSTLHGTDFIRRIWNDDILSTELLNRCLPENTERFKNSAQINVVFNVVEMLIASTTEDTFAFNVGTNSSIFSSLLKIFLIELPIKDDFMFYGLNRILGNNIDFRKIDATIPQTADILNNFSVLIPQPIPFELIEQNQENEAIRFELLSNHEFHLLNLRIKVADLLESYIIAKQSVEFLQHKEHFKSIIRIINFEQMYIIRSPRSKYIHLRIQIVSKLVKVLNYLTQDTRDLGNFIYPETMYELFVALSRIAFGSDSLSGEAHKLLLQVRSKGYVKDPIFNSWCEDKARELNHITNDDLQGKLLADLESDYANGLEFPYETDTVELAREILNIFVTHEEADNLYFNMKYEPDQGYDEMEFE